MRVNGMQKRQSIRSLTASDSRNVLVTVLIRLFLISTVITSMFPKTLSRNIKQYSRIRIIWWKSENCHKEKSVMQHTAHRLVLRVSSFNQKLKAFLYSLWLRFMSLHQCKISGSAEILKLILIYLNCITLKYHTCNTMYIWRAKHDFLNAPSAHTTWCEPFTRHGSSSFMQK